MLRRRASLWRRTSPRHQQPWHSQEAEYIKNLTSIVNPIVEIRRSYILISTMEFPTLARRHFYIESGPWISRTISAPAPNELIPQLSPSGAVTRLNIVVQYFWPSGLVQGQNQLNVKPAIGDYSNQPKIAPAYVSAGHRPCQSISQLHNKTFAWDHPSVSSFAYHGRI